MFINGEYCWNDLWHSLTSYLSIYWKKNIDIQLLYLKKKFSYTLNTLNNITVIITVYYCYCKFIQYEKVLQVIFQPLKSITLCFPHFHRWTVQFINNKLEVVHISFKCSTTLFKYFYLNSCFFQEPLEGVCPFCCKKSLGVGLLPPL